MNGAEPARLRVLLVGRTGLEGPLRRDERVELIRARTPLDAVGELGDPLETGGQEGAATVVVVAQGAVEGEDAARFVAAVRSLHAGARVAEVCDSGAQASAPIGAGFDGRLSSGAGFEELLSFVRGGANGADRAGVASPAVGLDEPVRLEAMTPGDDLDLVTATLSGRDPLLPALALLRARAGCPGLFFQPTVHGSGPGAGQPTAAGFSQGPPPPNMPDERGVPVAHQGRLFGWLVAPPSERGKLARGAAWLGAWLALGAQQAELRDAALLDELTGAFNRRYFDRYLAAALEQARALRQTLTLMLFDIDNFKTFNDRYGHPAGDLILRETVKLLRSVIRPGDKVCRVGGDEFAVVFYEPAGPRDPGSKPPESVASIAQRFQRQLREHRFPKLADEAPGALSVSAGLATFPWDGATAEALVAHADALALAGKRAGKNALTLGPAEPAG
jgi:diguanylate cyclase (GGDEF)-like protein